MIVTIDFKRYPSTYCLLQGRYFFCSKFQSLKTIFTSKLETPPFLFMLRLLVLALYCRSTQHHINLHIHTQSM